MRSAIAGGVSVCLFPIIPCRSPRYRLPRCHRRRSIRPPASSSLVPPIEPIPSRRRHHASAPHPRPHPLLASESIAYRPPACFVIISAVHHACGSYPPRLSPRHTCRGTGEGLRASCGLRTVRMSSPCCLLTPCRFHASDDLALTHLIPVAS